MDQIAYSISRAGAIYGDENKKTDTWKGHILAVVKKAPSPVDRGGLNRCPSPSGETPSGPELLRSRAAGTRALTAAMHELS